MCRFMSKSNIFYYHSPRNDPQNSSFSHESVSVLAKMARDIVIATAHVGEWVFSLKSRDRDKLRHVNNSVMLGALFEKSYFLVTC